MIKIEKGVPIVGTYNSGRYPFAQMEVGDSFEYDSTERTRISNAANYYAMGYQKKFRTRRQANGKYRVWRVS